jgi:hypothetical protein
MPAFFRTVGQAILDEKVFHIFAPLRQAARGLMWEANEQIGKYGQK